MGPSPPPTTMVSPLAKIARPCRSDLWLRSTWSPVMVPASMIKPTTTCALPPACPCAAPRVDASLAAPHDPAPMEWPIMIHLVTCGNLWRLLVWLNVRLYCDLITVTVTFHISTPTDLAMAFRAVVSSVKAGWRYLCLMQPTVPPVAPRIWLSRGAYLRRGGGAVGESP